MEPESLPRVSVLMAVYNGERYLAEALDSVFAQTLADFELVVVDDASTDATATILDDYAQRDGRVIVLRNDENRQLAAALNRGLAACRAPLVARADADDVNLPQRLERQVAFLGAHPDVGVVGCWYDKMDSEGRSLSTGTFPTDHETIYARQLFYSSFLHPSVMFRAGVVRGVGGYDEAYWTAQDSDLWTRLRDETRFANIPEALVRYRVHGDSIGGTRGSEGRRLSVTVPRRPIEALLGRRVSDEELSATVTLYRGSRQMNGDEFRVGLPILKEVLGLVRRTESPETARLMRREAAGSILRQAWDYGQLDRSAQRMALTTTAMLYPRLALSRMTLRSLPKTL